MHLAGRSHWASGRAQWSSAPGSVSVKVPGEVSVEQAREGGLEFQAVLFDTALVEEARAALERRLALPPMHAIDPRDPRAQPLRALHRQLLDEETPVALEEAVCDALHAMVDVVFAPRGAEPARRSTLSAPIARARAMLDARLTETTDLEALATHARLDKFRLCRAFREQVGLPPHAYVTHRRVALAQSFLARGMPQTEVAARVGFYDQSLLHRHFKRILGFTPGAFARATA
jgi:AraC-like DNA-binding protein